MVKEHYVTVCVYMDSVPVTVVQSRMLLAAEREFKDRAEGGALSVTGFDRRKLEAELETVRREAADWREGYHKLKADVDSGAYADEAVLRKATPAQAQQADLAYAALIRDLGIVFKLEEKTAVSIVRYVGDWLTKKLS